MPGWIITFLLILQFISSLRGLVIFSFVAHFFLVFFAGLRRHQPTGVRMFILWGANQFARWAPVTVLGTLSVGSTPQKEQLVTLWVAFMLLHAGMPDNFTAYSLEDTVLSRRQQAGVWYQLLGSASPFPFLLKNISFIISNGGDAMLGVSSLVLLMAIGKYWEGAFQALMQGNLKSMQSSRKKMKMKNNSTKSVRNSLQIARRGGREPNDEQILLAAHDMLDITKDAFIDFLDQNNADEQEALSATWDEKLYRVVNMELSLMYDLIYTKAAVVHSWKGYILRFASPIAATAAFVLFWLHSKEGQATADVVITYVLLAGMVVLDIKWLLRAVASTWFYSFLDERPRSWLHHALLCSGKWRLIRRLIVSDLNLFRILDNNKKPTRYRMWSQTIGQYNLLHECTRYESEARTKNWKSGMFKRLAPEENWMEYEYQRMRGNHIDSRDFRDELFNSIWQVLKKPFPQRRPPRQIIVTEAWRPAPAAPPFTHAHQEADLALKFTPDLQETILILHIATDIFLFSAESEIEASPKSKKDVEVIKALSDYMMFLVAVRPGMLPGLVLSSRYEAVSEALAGIWKEKEGSDPSLRTSSMMREKRLAEILIANEDEEGNYFQVDDSRPQSGFLSVLYDTSNVLSEGAILAMFLLPRIRGPNFRKNIIEKVGEHGDGEPPILKKFHRQFPDLMEFAKNVSFPSIAMTTDAIIGEWARQLINVSIRCTRDSHAKQLARGGELTTVVWILAEHARILRIKTEKKPASYDAV
ncbi:uncharacterized protein [Oryza sativa Japonica Group]|uniref:Os04g0147200 protein n=2 Tax=Oryza sativa subsp. japonica TaxID=39947 RepID=A0A8J8YAV0_ORYSJ|nr:uncharacterized protein LOC9271055 [Oryza sativa Japonica Group]XP_025880388.1 uncharacterized protein LOC9271055 [Oryza sativa Japonica Group]EAZ29620.1 hypothetical protein OsJ_13688 [Oryza sativa Japonica Group]CAD39535.3 OSJNBa0057M08.5 [Oryza sativa Japonica Group]BAH01352.1 unnamed protein product [Oryza sativa Japonica Group]BAH92478.1 Os04g0147200 [Oryza sativa Japonica Group]BAS87788.1 Os04g0147200 [Oryza sativa Japonica Group]|eukprot:NP_001173750.1 Os04g0147200 [Oryza sativa Japonica Group]